MSLPVILLHFGMQEYAEQCLRVTAHHNSPVFLIGDDASRRLISVVSGVSWIDYRSLVLSDDAGEFIDHFVNYSTNSRIYELTCFLRLYYIEALMQQLSITACFHIDSDCALLTNVSQVAFQAPDALLVYPDFGNPHRMAASIHSARVTSEFIREYRSMIKAAYVEGRWPLEILGKRDYHIQNKVAGGICDMTFYSLVARHFHVDNLGCPAHGAVFDYRLCTGEGEMLEHQYEMVGDRKRIFRGQGCLSVRDSFGQLVRLRSLHFQGEAKMYCAELPVWLARTLSSSPPP